MQTSYFIVLEVRGLKWVSLNRSHGAGRVAFFPGGSRGEAVSLPFSRCKKKKREQKRLITLPKAMLQNAKAETQTQLCPDPDHSLTRADCKDPPRG